MLHLLPRWLITLSISLSIPILFQLTRTQVSTFTSTKMSVTKNGATSKTPVYFLGIGGPNFMENRSHPAFVKLGQTGREITQQVKPKAVVVISAHWQHSPHSAAINIQEQGEIIYDFYGFPPHYYEYTFPHRGSREAPS